MKTRLVGPQFQITTKMASCSRVTDTVNLTEDDIPGASLAGRNPSLLNSGKLRQGPRSVLAGLQKESWALAGNRSNMKQNGGRNRRVVWQTISTE